MDLCVVNHCEKKVKILILFFDFKLLNTHTIGFYDFFVYSFEPQWNHEIILLYLNHGFVVQHMCFLQN